MRSNERINILSCNCGSSSLKFKLIQMPSEKVLIEGEAEKVGVKISGKSIIKYKIDNEVLSVACVLKNHMVAFNKIIDIFNKKSFEFSVIAHRYVHPGNLYKNTVKVDKEVLLKLKDTLGLAPIHNPVIFGLIEYCASRFAAKPQYITFDTSFHHTIPKEFATYPINSKIANKYYLKRKGFHGISHKYIMQEACKFLDVKVRSQCIISCHLGTGGSSLCAIQSGRSIHNSMGFSPLEGLMMNTRSGNVDLGAVLYIIFKEKLSIQKAEQLLNKKSGISGLCDYSSDLREIIKNVDHDSSAEKIVHMYINRVRKYIGYYSLILKKADILVFTDTIGVSQPWVREKICTGLKFFGIDLDHVKNRQYCRGTADVSSKNSQTKVLVLPTDEELMIVREAYSRMLS